MEETTGADPVSAIAGAIGSLFNTISVFAAKSAQRYGLNKSIEAEGISVERQKTLAAYTGVGNTQLMILGLMFFLVIALYFKNKK